MPATAPDVDQPPSKQAVTHMVLLRVREDVPRNMVENVFEEIGALQSKIAGILSYAWGPNSSPEGINRGYTHGFCMTFVDSGARDAYLPHPEHERVKKAVLSVADGGIDGLLAFDFAS
jgi:Stress responsive A/B Barrel Domain